MKKRVFYTELAYVIGLLILSFGTALMEAADFGVSMVVAPAYLIYLKVSQFLPFFTFGMAEYMLQAALLVATSVILCKFKISYLFFFCYSSTLRFSFRRIYAYCSFSADE